MVCIMLLCSGVQLFCLGIVGEYLAKTYLEVKHRPVYIAKETESRPGPGLKTPPPKTALQQHAQETPPKPAK